MYRIQSVVFHVAIILGAHGVLRAGPISELYVVHRGSVQVSVLQGDSVVRSWSMANNGQQSAISVTDQVSIASNIGDGATYDLDGNFIATVPNTPGNARDGASDGEFNYQFSGDALLRYDLDWLNPVTQIDFGVSSASWGGVTYDPTNDTFWITSVNAFFGQVQNVDRDGNNLFSFTTGDFLGGEAGIAYDAADDTLWVGNVFADRSFRQFSKTGQLLDTVEFNTLPANSAFEGGMEFRVPLKNQGDPGGGGMTPVPEPSTIALLGFGLAGILATRRKRRD